MSKGPKVWNVVIRRRIIVLHLHCLLVVGTKSSIGYTVVFDLFPHMGDLDKYVSTFEQTLHPQVQWMCGSNQIKESLSRSFQTFGCLIELNSLVQLTQLRRVFLNSNKGKHVFTGRPGRIKLRPSVPMSWNYAMKNVDVSKILMLQATVSCSTGLGLSKTRRSSSSRLSSSTPMECGQCIQTVTKSLADLRRSNLIIRRPFRWETLFYSCFVDSHFIALPKKLATSSFHFWSVSTWCQMQMSQGLLLLS